MLKAHQLSQRIAALAAGKLSVLDFEDWFRVESRNVHLWGDDQLNEAVFSVETVFSEYYAGCLDDEGLKRELADAIRPFEQSAGKVEIRVNPQMRARRESDTSALRTPVHLRSEWQPLPDSSGVITARAQTLVHTREG